MMLNRRSSLLALLLATAVSGSGCLNKPGPASNTVASQRMKPGFNIFSPAEDIEMGRESAERILRQTRMLDDPRIAEYLEQLGSKLAAHASGEKFDYQFRVVATREINAFALPGGFLFVNAGLLEAVRNEGELAGVVAHEIAHSALRHGTSQASKQQIAQLGLGILGSLAGASENRSLEQTIGAIGGLGANMLFLRFGRTAEKEADLEGARMMAQAGYDPRDMAAFFVTLESLSSHRLPEMLSDHPNPGNRQQYITAAIPNLPVSPNPVKSTPEFTSMRSRLAGEAGSIDRNNRLRRVGPKDPTSLNQITRPAAPDSLTSPFQAEDGSFSLRIPANWSPLRPDNNNWLFAPEGALATMPDKSAVLTHGLLISLLNTSGASVQEATSLFLQRMVEANPDFSIVNPPQPTNIAGLSGLVSVVAGQSPVTGTREVDVTYTVITPRGALLCLIIVAPEDEIHLYQAATRQLLGSLILNR